MKDNRKIFITGGMRSGKSRYALTLSKRFLDRRIFLATAQPIDEEMKKRIEKHQKERGTNFMTVEEPIYLGKALKGLSNGVGGMVIIDCLTVWVNNLFYHMKEDEVKIKTEIDLFVDVLVKSSCNFIVISNESGWGVIPPNKLSRQFIDVLGSLNQRLAAMSDGVVLMVSGIPQWLKGNGYEKLSGLRSARAGRRIRV